MQQVLAGWLWLAQVSHRSRCCADAPWFGPGKNFSFLKVDPALDLDGPQLDYASQHPHMLRYDIGYANSEYSNGLSLTPATSLTLLPQTGGPRATSGSSRSSCGRTCHRHSSTTKPRTTAGAQTSRAASRRRRGGGRATKWCWRRSIRRTRRGSLGAGGAWRVASLGSGRSFD